MKSGISRKISGLAAMAVVLVFMAANRAGASPIAVGAGSDSAYLVFNWAGSSDTFAVDYAISFDGALNGYDLAVRADTSDDALALTWGSFQVPDEHGNLYTSYFLDKAQYVDGNTTYIGDGYIAPDGWWHYWTDQTVGNTWTSPTVGAVDVPVSNGDRNGWVFGTTAAPVASAVPEPATAALALLGAGALMMRRRRHVID